MLRLEVVEGSSGTWFYHLRRGDSGPSLCGAHVMPTKVRLDSWGLVTHLRERYCEACAAAANLKTGARG